MPRPWYGPRPRPGARPPRPPGVKLAFLSWCIVLLFLLVVVDVFVYISRVYSRFMRKYIAKNLKLCDYYVRSFALH